MPRPRRRLDSTKTTVLLRDLENDVKVGVLMAPILVPSNASVMFQDALHQWGKGPPLRFYCRGEILVLN